jgi:hypothetical protein
MVPFLKEDKNSIHYKKIAWRIQETTGFAPVSSCGWGRLNPSRRITPLKGGPPACSGQRPIACKDCHGAVHLLVLEKKPAGGHPAG